MSSSILTGTTRDHVKPIEDNLFIHAAVLDPLRQMKEGAKREGIEIKVVSGFRDFSAQLTIWNKKCRGERAILDAKGHPLDPKIMSAEEIIFAILRWSALPGMSRHHWGTDIDVVDAASMPKSYQVQLIPQEAAPGGVFHKIATWLPKNISRFGFFRPYEKDLGGISPEWWHLSYAPIAQPYYQTHRLELVRDVIQANDMELKDDVIRHLPTIFDTYFRKICLP